METKTKTIAAGIFKWLGRVSACLLLLLWGAFFVEHVYEWFIKPEVLPPVKVWFGMLLHFIMLVGLAMLVKWERVGLVVATIGTAAFFFVIGYGSSNFPIILLINMIPIALIGISMLINRKDRQLDSQPNQH